MYVAEKNLTFIEHLAELRNRLVVIAVSVLVGTIVSFLFVEQLTALVLEPAKDLQFVYLSPPELFLAYIRMSLVVGITVTSPIILVQIWSFVQPGLIKKEKIYLSIALIAGVFFFMLGVVFAYVVILPLTIEFFVGMRHQDIEPMFSMGNYVGFISSILLSFGLVFEMPTVVVILAQLGLIRASTLRKNRKFVYLAIVVAAAVLSPPDVVSQFLLAGPMVLLFELSVAVATLIERRKIKQGTLSE